MFLIAGALLLSTDNLHFSSLFIHSQREQIVSRHHRISQEESYWKIGKIKENGGCCDQGCWKGRVKRKGGERKRAVEEEGRDRKMESVVTKAAAKEERENKQQTWRGREL